MRRDITNAIASWVQQEAADKWNQEWDTSSWPRVAGKPGVDMPRQYDGSSCGLYAIAMAACLEAGVALEHCHMTDGDALHVRANILSAICAGMLYQACNII